MSSEPIPTVSICDTIESLRLHKRTFYYDQLIKRTLPILPLIPLLPIAFCLHHVAFHRIRLNPLYCSLVLKDEEKHSISCYLTNRILICFYSFYVKEFHEYHLETQRLMNMYCKHQISLQHYAVLYHQANPKTDELERLVFHYGQYNHYFIVFQLPIALVSLLCFTNHSLRYIVLASQFLQRQHASINTNSVFDMPYHSVFVIPYAWKSYFEYYHATSFVINDLFHCLQYYIVSLARVNYQWIQHMMDICPHDPIQTRHVWGQYQLFQHPIINSLIDIASSILDSKHRNEYMIYKQLAIKYPSSDILRVYVERKQRKLNLDHIVLYEEQDVLFIKDNQLMIDTIPKRNIQDEIKQEQIWKNKFMELFNHQNTMVAKQEWKAVRKLLKKAKREEKKEAKQKDEIRESETQQNRKQEKVNEKKETPKQLRRIEAAEKRRIAEEKKKNKDCIASSSSHSSSSTSSSSTSTSSTLIKTPLSIPPKPNAPKTNSSKQPITQSIKQSIKPKNQQIKPITKPQKEEEDLDAIIKDVYASDDEELQDIIHHYEFADLSIMTTHTIQYYCYMLIPFIEFITQNRQEFDMLDHEYEGLFRYLKGLHTNIHQILYGSEKFQVINNSILPHSCNEIIAEYMGYPFHRHGIPEKLNRQTMYKADVYIVLWMQTEEYFLITNPYVASYLRPLPTPIVSGLSLLLRHIGIIMKSYRSLLVQHQALVFDPYVAETVCKRQYQPLMNPKKCKQLFDSWKLPPIFTNIQIFVKLPDLTPHTSPMYNVILEWLVQRHYTQVSFPYLVGWKANKKKHVK